MWLTHSGWQMWVWTRTHIFSRGSGHLDPRLGEEGAWTKHEDNVDDGVNRIIENRTKWLGRRKVVTQAAYWVGPSWSATRGILNKRLWESLHQLYHLYESLNNLLVLEHVAETETGPAGGNECVIYSQTRFLGDWRGSCHWNVLTASERWRRGWRPGQTAEWWGCWRCRTAWWDMYCTGRGSELTWWADQPWIPVGRS